MSYHSENSGYWVELGHLSLYSLAFYVLSIKLNLQSQLSEISHSN